MTTRGERPCPVVLIIVDGFGYGPDPAVDAIAAADMPRWRALLAEWPNARLEASAHAVGLPDGQMGNSEVGHLNIGAGRPVLQDLPRIDAAIADGSFERNEVLLAAVQQAAQPMSRLHLVGLIGPGGVHSTDGHAVAIAALAREAGVTDSSCTVCSTVAIHRRVRPMASSATSRPACWQPTRPLASP